MLTGVDLTSVLQVLRRQSTPERRWKDTKKETDELEGGMRDL